MQEAAEVLTLCIQEFSSKGYGVARLPSGAPIEVAHVVPGDAVRIARKGGKRPPHKGRLLEVLAPSRERVIPRCGHVGICGGCSWQQVSYSAQLREKEARVRAAFEDCFPIDSILPCESPFHYRNKMEFSFSENRGGQRFFGLMIAQAEPYVFNISECHLAPPWFAAVVFAVREWWEKTGVKAYVPREDTGSLRYLTLREGTRTGHKMVILNVSGNPEFALGRAQLESFVAAVRSLFQEPISIFLRIHQTKKGKPTRFYEMHLFGSDHLIEELHIGGRIFSFKVSPSSFFQPNTLQAEKLYAVALEMLGTRQLVYDLYCGAGSLTTAAASVAKRVIGIELAPEAVLDAEENLRRNRVENASIYQGDVGKVLQELRESPDAVLLDPPRAGLDLRALSHLKALRPAVIVYISCNPLTQAANIKELLKEGYRLIRLQPVDQFPHTYHIENVALLHL